MEYHYMVSVIKAYLWACVLLFLSCCYAIILWTKSSTKWAEKNALFEGEFLPYSTSHVEILDTQAKLAGSDALRNVSFSFWDSEMLTLLEIDLILGV